MRTEKGLTANDRTILNFSMTFPNFWNVSNSKTETFKTRNLLSPKVGVWVLQNLQVFPNDSKWLQWKSPNVTLRMDLLLQYFLQDPRPDGSIDFWKHPQKKKNAGSEWNTHRVSDGVCDHHHHHHHHHHRQMMMTIIT